MENRILATQTMKSAEGSPSFLWLILLHLIPGVLGTVLYLLTAPLIPSLGYPTLVALYVALPLTPILLELGFLLYQGQKQNGRLTLKGIVQYREPLPRRQYLVFSILIFVLGAAGAGLLNSIDKALLQPLFDRLPDWYLLKTLSQVTEQYPRSVSITLLAINLVLSGMAGPIVQEMYFRGYLLPRLEEFGRDAPFINTVLFSLSQFSAPWQFFTIIGFCLPLAYIVRRKRNIYLGMIVLCVGSVLAAFPTLLRLMQ